MTSIYKCLQNRHLLLTRTWPLTPHLYSSIGLLVNGTHLSMSSFLFDIDPFLLLCCATQIETSFCGLSVGPRSGLHLRGHDWNKLGESFCCTLQEILLPNSGFVRKASARLVNLYPDKFRQASAGTETADLGRDISVHTVDDDLGTKSDRSVSSSRSSKSKRHGSHTPKRSKSRRGARSGISDDTPSKGGSGRSRSSSGRSRSKKKSSGSKK